MWTKLDDTFWAHPKVMEAGNEAIGVFCRMLSYCARYSDGEVPDDAANIISAGTNALEQLAEVGLIERRKADWLIPSYLTYNPSRNEWDENCRKARERKQRWQESHEGNGSRPITERELEEGFRGPR